MGLLDNSITQFPYGVNDQGQSSTLGQLPMLVNPFAKYGTFLDEFNTLPVDDVDYAITLSGGGALTMNTTLPNGNLNIATATAAGVASLLGLSSYVLAPSKKFAARFKLRFGTTAFNATILGVGLGNASAATAAGITDGIILTKADALAALTLSVRAASATVASAVVATATSALDLILDLYFDGTDRLYYGVNGSYAGYLTLPALPAVPIIPFIHQIAGAAAGATTVTVVDTIFVTSER